MTERNYTPEQLDGLRAAALTATPVGGVSLKEKLRRVLQHVEFPGYEFIVGGEDRVWLRARFLAADSESGYQVEQLTRRWYVSQDTTTSEIVQTAFKCVLTALEHEAREHFKYKGEAVLGPHHDVDHLAQMCKTAREARR